MAVIGCETGDGAATGQRSQAIEETADLFVLERSAIEPWLAGQPERLATIEATLDDALRAGYSARLDTAEGHEQIVRTALVHWARLVRQHLREPLHTKVEALTEDPECHGSIAGDALLLQYVEAIAGHDTGAVERVVLPLRELARHMACLGEVQSSHLASQMVSAFDDVRTTLRVNRLDAAVPYVAQAISVPMLLVHEVERQHGETAPLSRWFVEYEAALIDGALTLHHPATWHGLWIYDRITGRLRGFRATREPVDENDIDLVAFFHTVAQPQRDDQKCSFAEMVQRGSYDQRYFCMGARCLDPSDPACALPSSAGDTRPDDGAFDMLGLATTSLVECISNQVAHPAGKQMACVIEATGLAANPREMLAKGLQTTTLAGIKGGGPCQLSATVQDAWTKHDQAEKAARDKERTRVDAAIAKQTEATDKLATAQKAADVATMKYDADPDDPYTKFQKEVTADAVDRAEEAVNKAHNFTAKETTDAALLRDAEIKQADDDLQTDLATAVRCPIGSTCGNGCGAMSAQAQKVLDCFDGDFGEPDPVRGPGGCNGVCDPIDPDTTQTGLTCLTELDRNPGALTAASCWAAKCGPSDQASGGTCCGRGGTTMGTPEIRSLCEQARCEDTSATYDNSACGCGGSLTGGIPGRDPLMGVGPQMCFPLEL